MQAEFQEVTQEEPNLHPSGITPTLQNLVATVNLECKLDLKTIALHARNAEYNPKRFAAVIMRIREPKTTALIFASGKIVVTGAKSEEQSKLASRKYARIIQKLGFQAKFSEFKIQNIVGSCDVKFPIRLEGLAYSHGHFSSYEPELFPGLIYRMVRPKIVLLIFVSGKIVLTGAKLREEIYQAFENIYPATKPSLDKMGQLLTRLMSLFWSNKEVRILILGLDGAGKTTILYRLQMGDIVTTIPTIGFNVETVTYKNLRFQVWDLGGQTSIRPYWRCYYANTDAVIYVVDASDHERIGTSGAELKSMLDEEELKDAALLVFANKQDMGNALSAADISERLGLTELRDRQWTIFKCSAKTGDGLNDGLDWLVNIITSKK